MKLTLARFAIKRTVQLNELKTKIKKFSQLRPTSLTLHDLFDMTNPENLDKSCKFLASELPIRFSGALTEMESLPAAFKKVDMTQTLYEMYCSTFNETLDFYERYRNGKVDINEYFQSIENILHRHSNVVELMATGHAHYKRENVVPIHEDRKINYFLDRFFMRRISVRMICHQTLLAYRISQDPSLAEKKHFEAVEKNCDVKFILKLALDNVALLCEQQFFCSPTVNIECITENSDKPITVTYAPNYLYYILFEVLKNAFRAVVEYHHCESTVPDIKIQIIKGTKDVVIVIHDEGGGIPVSLSHRIFHYMYSTAQSPIAEDGAPLKLSTMNTPFAGFGYGLPLSRLYARYLHGDLVFISQEGFGSKVFIYLSSADDMASEILPICNIASRRVFSTTGKSLEWVAS